ncbi:UNVERIFIED_CONTAM: hypothetical protein FKN15_065223 [Acipenser sinensis]
MTWGEKYTQTPTSCMSRVVDWLCLCESFVFRLLCVQFLTPTLWIEVFSLQYCRSLTLHRTTVLAAVAFLDAFQKVADMATNTRGELLGISVFPRGPLSKQHQSKKALGSAKDGTLMYYPPVPIQELLPTELRSASLHNNPLL